MNSTKELKVEVQEMRMRNMQSRYVVREGTKKLYYL